MRIQVVIWLLLAVTVWGNGNVREGESNGTEAFLPDTDRSGIITSSTRINIKVKKKIFKCTIKFLHKFDVVILAKSTLKCSPPKPKNQKANNIKVAANDFIFLINVAINPSKITKARVISVPETTTPIPTTTEVRTTSTEKVSSSTPLFLPGTTLPGGNCTCGQANRVPRIVNGEETEINEYPWIAGLVSAGDSQVWCGATLISSQWVMTAAHCTEESYPEGIQVLLGEHNYYDDFETRSLRADVAEIIIHPKYDSSTVDYDFSLLKLVEPVDFDSFPNIRPICLPENPEETYVQNLATVSGWGTTSSGGSLSHYLQEVEVNVLSNDECNGPDYAYDGKITDRMMCANVEGGGKDSCQGDSGGPLVTQNPDLYELIGVVSWGYGCALPDAPGVYARMTKVLNWVRETTAESWSSCPRCEDPVECPGSVVGPGPGPVIGEPVTAPNNSSSDCCMFNEDCIKVDTTIPRPEKCEWLACMASSSGPSLIAQDSADSVHCCLGEYDTMYQDGEEMMLTSGQMVTCCKGRWMEPIVENGEAPVILT